MENGVATACFTTGMGAIGTMLFALLRAGDHFVSSAFLFGNTNSLFASFANHGVDVTFVDATSVDAVAAAIRPNTRLVFVETIANPRTQVADLEAIGELCRSRNLVYVVDNTMTSPYLFQPNTVGASIVVNALTKYIAGHGNVLGGSLTEQGHYDWQTFTEHRTGIPHRESAAVGFDADPEKRAARLWRVARRRKRRTTSRSARRRWRCASSGSATTRGRWWPRSSGTRVCRRCFIRDSRRIRNTNSPRGCFAIRVRCSAFELDGAIDVFDFLNRLDVVIKSSNLGDNRTLAIPVAHTIYYEMGAQRRASMGIADSLIRISVGIEDTADLLADFEQALGGATS